jgi:hypothetical protein
MQPPPLAVVARGKLSFQICFSSVGRVRILKSFSRYAALLSPPVLDPLTCFALHQRFPPGVVRISLVSKQRRIAARLRNFDTQPRSSHCYEVRSDNRLESVANAHTAADLHVRPVS